LLSPQVAVENGDPWSVPLRLPTGREQTPKFGFVAENDYICVSQGMPAP
jgi:hypothetical protein